MRHSWCACALVAAFTLAPATATIADDGTAPAVVTFDEIDHVYTTGEIPPPGSFDQDLRDVVHTAAPPAARKKTILQGAMQTLNVAGTQLSNAVSIVGSSGQIGRTLNIADGAYALAPAANMMGLAGNGKVGVLLQTYVLPHMSPSAAQFLSDFLTARSDYQARYPGTSTAAATVPSSPAPDLARYGHGSLRNYTIANNGWARIEDPDAHVYVILEPDQGKAYAVDDTARTVHAVAYDAAVPPATSSSGSGPPVVTNRADALGPMTLGTATATGFRTKVVMKVAADQRGCAASTVTSDRVEYFSGIHIASDAANASPLAPTGAHDTCVPAGGVVSRGSIVPPGLLLLYQANTIERKTTSGIDRYTVVIERGNVRTLSDAARSAFRLPDGYRQV